MRAHDEHPETWERRRQKKLSENPNLGDLHKPLGVMVSQMMWPTARSEDSECSGRRHSRGVSDTLTAVSRDWRTPNGTDWKGESAHSWQTRTDGDPTPRLSDQVATLDFHLGRQVLRTTPPGPGCSPAGPTSPPLLENLWRTPTEGEASRNMAWATQTYLSDQVQAFPTSPPLWQGPARRLNYRFVSWLMAFPPDWCAEIPRVDALRCLGNAVVAPQAAAAIRELWQALEEHRESQT